MAAAAAQFEHAIFFDNQPSHLEEVGKLCRNVQLVEIGQSAPDAPHIMFDSSAFSDYMKRVDLDNSINAYKIPDDIKGNIYVWWLIHAVKANGDAIDTMSGIQEHHLPIVNEWLEETKGSGKKRAALFDWDRTITMVEGVRLHTKKELDSESWQRYLRHGLSYICGGEARIKMLRTLFQTLHKAGVTLILLTNNLACKYQEYDEITKLLFKDVPYFKICSIETPHLGNKGKALFHHKEFLPMCGPKPPARAPVHKPTLNNSEYNLSNILEAYGAPRPASPTPRATRGGKRGGRRKTRRYRHKTRG